MNWMQVRLSNATALCRFLIIWISIHTHRVIKQNRGLWELTLTLTRAANAI